MSLFLPVMASTIVVKLLVVRSYDARRNAVSVCQSCLALPVSPCPSTVSRPAQNRSSSKQPPNQESLDVTRPQRQGALAAASSTDGVAQDERSTASMN